MFMADPHHLTIQPLDAEQLGHKSREELELLLRRADEVIRAKDSELAVVAKLGQSLLQHNVELKQQSETLLARLSLDQHTIRKVPSLLLSPSVAAHICGAPKHPLPCSPEAEWHADTGEDHVIRTPLKRSPNRPRVSSRASVTSNLSVSDLITTVTNTESTICASLRDLNAELATQVEELQSDLTRRELDARKHARKFSEIKEELERAWEKNEELESRLQEAARPLSVSLTASAMPLAKEPEQDQDNGAETLAFHPTTPKRPLFRPRRLRLFYTDGSCSGTSDTDTDGAPSFAVRLAESEQARARAEARLEQVETELREMKKTFADLEELSMMGWHEGIPKRTLASSTPSSPSLSGVSTPSSKKPSFSVDARSVFDSPSFARSRSSKRRSLGQELDALSCGNDSFELVPSSEAHSDYWPASFFSRNTPKMLFRRVIVFASTCLGQTWGWVRFFVFLSAAVVAALHDGPHPSNRRRSE